MIKINITSKPCPMCKSTVETLVDRDTLRRYNQGEGHVQILFPNMSPADRERFFITGYCSDCWDKIFCTHDDECEVHDGKCS